MRDLRLIAAAAESLYDNRLGWDRGKAPHAPRAFWRALGLALGRDQATWNDTAVDGHIEVELERGAALELLADHERAIDAAMRRPERDYTDVHWPWERDPHWQPPREGATSDADEPGNWRLACRREGCERWWPHTVDRARIIEHVVDEHPDQVTPAGSPVANVDMVWVGLGTPPVNAAHTIVRR